MKRLVLLALLTSSAAFGSNVQSFVNAGGGWDWPTLKGFLEQDGFTNLYAFNTVITGEKAGQVCVLPATTSYYNEKRLVAAERVADINLENAVLHGPIRYNWSCQAK